MVEETPQENTSASHLVSVGQAAEILGLTPDGVRKRLQRGLLSGLKTEGVWYVRLDRDADSSAGQTVQDSNTPRISSPRRQDKNRAGHGARQDRLEGLYRELVEQLKGENSSLREQLAFQQQELERKDVLLASFAQRFPALEAPRPQPVAVESQVSAEAVASSSSAPSVVHRPWWRFWARSQVHSPTA